MRAIEIRSRHRSAGHLTRRSDERDFHALLLSNGRARPLSVGRRTPARAERPDTRHSRRTAASELGSALRPVVSAARSLVRLRCVSRRSKGESSSTQERAVARSGSQDVEVLAPRGGSRARACPRRVDPAKTGRPSCPSRVPRSRRPISGAWDTMHRARVRICDEWPATGGPEWIRARAGSCSTLRPRRKAMLEFTRLNPYRELPDAFKALSALEAAVAKSGLDPGLLDLVRTAVSQLNGCAFCLDMHQHDARKRARKARSAWTSWRPGARSRCIRRRARRARARRGADSGGEPRLQRGGLEEAHKAFQAGGALGAGFRHCVDNS